MYFEQFYLTCLSHVSCLIGAEGIAAVVDPQRDVDFYLAEARRISGRSQRHRRFRRVAHPRAACRALTTQSRVLPLTR